MARAETDYLQELTVHLRLAGLTGKQIGAVLEETRDHLAASGQAPQDAFGPAEDYARALAVSHRTASPARGIGLTRGDLIAGAAQLAGWVLLVFGLSALRGPGGVEILPGHLAGLVVLTAGLVWPVWPATRAFAARRISVVVPLGAMVAVVGAWVALTQVWASPVLVTLSPWAAVLVGAAVIAGCWVRVWLLRDPVRRPAGDAR